MKKPPKEKLPPLVKRMRATGQILCCGHNTAGNKVYWLEPSQKKVGSASAQRAISCPLVASSRDSLLENDAQTYRYAGAGA